MNILRNQLLTAITILVVSSATVVMIGCSQPPSFPKGAVGNRGRYNYSPSVIETGNIRQFWWCSDGVNPADTSQTSDAIYYESINMLTRESLGPILVLAETPGAWDSVYTCNPKVIGGVFRDPLGDGQDYSYAMYYVGTASPLGINNSIGVAFSKDGILWKKYPHPVIQSTSRRNYGVGQPALYNADHKAAIYMFYEDNTPPLHHVAAVSADGLHFTVQGTLTSNGLDPDEPQSSSSWGDMAYDAQAGEWYAVFNRPLRRAMTTGGVVEAGQYGIELYKIPQGALLTGASSWKQLINIDTSTTGFESNCIAGFVRDTYGNINVAAYPTIQMYASVSNPPPDWQATPAEAGMSDTPAAWILMPQQWTPDPNPTIPFNRYINASVHEVTTGWISPNGGFHLEELLGHLYANPHDGANVPFYSCKRGQEDYFVSLDVGCEGQRILGKVGYGYSKPMSGVNLVALYRCSTVFDHFVSKDPRCEGQTADGLLGYVVP